MMESTLPPGASTETPIPNQYIIDFQMPMGGGSSGSGTYETRVISPTRIESQLSMSLSIPVANALDCTVLLKSVH
jgi:hypothetical protein